MQTKFKIGDIINSSISSPQEVIDIRLGVPSDFGKICNWTGELCYVLRYVGGKNGISVYGIGAVESDHHLKGSEMFELYQSLRDYS
jgi:hypothetical protein